MSRHSQRSRTRRRNRGRLGPLFKLLCFGALAVALTAGATVFFRVERVAVSGNQRYTQEEVIAAAGVQLGDNLFALNKYRLSERIRQSLPYIGEASIQRGLPSTILITVTERGAVARILPSEEALAAPMVLDPEPDPEGDGSGAEPEEKGEETGEDPPVEPVAREAWLINASGKLLEPAPADSTVPAVAGLTALTPQAGVKLTVPPEEQPRLDALLSLLAELEAEDMFSKVSSVRLESTRMVVRYLDRFDVRLALNGDFHYSLQVLETVEEQITQKHGPDATGVMDLTQEGYDLVYSPG